MMRSTCTPNNPLIRVSIEDMESLASERWFHQKIRLFMVHPSMHDVNSSFGTYIFACFLFFFFFGSFGYINLLAFADICMHVLDTRLQFFKFSNIPWTTLKIKAFLILGMERLPSICICILSLSLSVSLCVNQYLKVINQSNTCSE